MNKHIAVFCALSITGMFAAVGTAGIDFGLGNVDLGADIGDDLGNVTTDVTEIFTAIIPMVAIVSLLGGLMSALPKMFKFST